MRTIKFAIIALVLACSFQAAEAQVRVGLNVGFNTAPPPRRVFVERRHPVRPYVYHRPVYRRGYYAAAPRYQYHPRVYHPRVYRHW